MVCRVHMPVFPQDIHHSVCFVVCMLCASNIPTHCPTNMYTISCVFMHTFIHPYTHTLIHPYKPANWQSAHYTKRSMYMYNLLCIHAYIHSPIHSYTHTLIHPYRPVSYRRRRAHHHRRHHLSRQEHHVACEPAAQEPDSTFVWLPTAASECSLSLSPPSLSLLLSLYQYTLKASSLFYPLKCFSTKLRKSICSFREQLTQTVSFHVLLAALQATNSHFHSIATYWKQQLQ